jgi:imidazolonepropionase-like amidohydrolase
MKKLIFILLLIPGAVTAVNAQQPAAIAFTNVTVIDATGAPPKPMMTVVVTGNRIVALGRTGKTKVPKDATVIDASGKFLIPGLWDMHVHTVMPPNFMGDAYEAMLSLCVANGVTGVRDTHGELELGKRMKAEIADGKRIGPRLFISGPLLDGPLPINRFGISLKTEAEARQAVVKLKTGGADFIKVYSRLPRHLYFAIADECKKQGITFVGHVPYSVSAAEASDAGQKSFEHLTGVTMASSTKEEEIRGKLVAGSDKPYGFGEFLQSEYLPLDGYNSEKAAALFARFARNKTYQVPTLSVLHSISSWIEPPRADERLNYMPAQTRGFWASMKPTVEKNTPAEDFNRYQKVVEKADEIVRQMLRAGVPLLAGTDTPNPHVYPGFSLHDELALLVRAGLTPTQALETATINPARYFGKEKELGTIEVGKLADLVLLDASPLADIRNTQKINAVVANGRLFTRATLQKMLSDIAAANAPKQK